MSTMNRLKSSRLDVRNAFIGSIQVSLAPKDAILDSVCRDLATRVSVRRAFGFTSSVLYVSNCNFNEEKCHLPFNSPNN
jgi:hypothetical protein